MLVFYPVTIADTDILSSFSVLPALSLEGVVYSDIVKGLYDGDKFVHFVDELTDIMNPYPGKHSVLVMDNCKIHHVPVVEEVCAQKYVSSSYLNNTNHNIIGVSSYCIYPHTPLTTTQSKNSFPHTRHSCSTMPLSFSWLWRVGRRLCPFNFLYNGVEEVGKVDPRGWFAHAHYILNGPRAA